MNPAFFDAYKFFFMKQQEEQFKMKQSAQGKETMAEKGFPSLKAQLGKKLMSTTFSEGSAISPRARMQGASLGASYKKKRKDLTVDVNSPITPSPRKSFGPDATSPKSTRTNSPLKCQK